MFGLDLTVTLAPNEARRALVSPARGAPPPRDGRGGGGGGHPGLQVALVADAPQLVAAVPVVREADAVPLLQDRPRGRCSACGVAGVEAAAGAAVDQHGVLRAGGRARPAVTDGPRTGPAPAPLRGAVSGVAVGVLDHARAVGIRPAAPVEHQALARVAGA